MLLRHDFCVCLHSSGFSPAGSVDEWQTELDAGEVSTTNSLKHTTDIKDDERREKHGGEEEREKALVTDQIRVKMT